MEQMFVDFFTFKYNFRLLQLKGSLIIITKR